MRSVIYSRGEVVFLRHFGIGFQRSEEVREVWVLGKMSFTLRSVKVPPNSVNIEEARRCVFDFFRQACRSIPSVIDMYNLDDVVTVSQLRSNIASEIRKNSHVTNPKVSLSLSLFSFFYLFLSNFSENYLVLVWFLGKFFLGDILWVYCYNRNWKWVIK